MKKSSKKSILFNFLFIATIAVFVLAYVGVKLKYDILAKDELMKERELQKSKNSRTNLYAQMQSLSSESKIVNTANKNLGLVKYLKPDETIQVQETKIKVLSKKLGSKK